MNNFDWIKEVEWEKELTGELLEIALLVGIDNLLLLMNRFKKTPVYFSEEPLQVLKRKYILKHFKPGNAKELARDLGMSERWVYKIINDSGIVENQLDIFSESDN